MKHNNIQQRTSVQIAVLFLTLSGAGQAMADTPLSLTVSETLTYDNNILRNERVKVSDVVSSTGVRVGFDKDYGRQNYHASVQGIVERYKKLTSFDNDGYEINLGLTTEIGKDLSFSLDHNANQSLQDFGDQGFVKVKEVISSSSTVADARYGLHGRWSLTGNLSRDDIQYDLNQQQDKTATGVRMGLRYSPTDLMYFDGGLRRTVSELPRYPLYVDTSSGVPVAVGDRIKRVDLDFRTGWTVTGYSILSAQLNWTDEKHETMTAGVVNDSARNFKGLTGRFNWQYLPTGKMSYLVAFDRDTNNAGGSTSVVNVGKETGQSFDFFGVRKETQKRLSTGLNVSATWKATPKISATAGWRYRRLQEERSDIGSGLGESQTGNFKSLSLGLSYVFTRSLRFNCSANTYDRTATVFSNAYSGESLACTAAFTLN